MQAKGIKVYLVIRAGYLKSLKVPNAPICCLSGAILVDLRVMGGAWCLDLLFDVFFLNRIVDKYA